MHTAKCNQDCHHIPNSCGVPFQALSFRPESKKTLLFENDETSMSTSQLLHHDSDLFKQCACHGFTPLHYACRDGYDFSRIERLVDRCPAALEIKSNHGRTPIDILLLRYEYDLEYDNRNSRLVATLISKYPAKLLEVSSQVLGLTFGPTITAAVKSSPTMKILDLQRIQLTKDALMVLLEPHTFMLQELSFDWIHSIDTDVCTALQQLLRQNTTLQHLLIRTRFLDLPEKELLQDALDLQQNTSLKTLDLQVIPQYKLYLLLGESLPENCIHQVERATLDTKLALNRAGRLAATKEGFVEMLDRASESMSAQYFLLKSAPHFLNQ